MPQHDNAPSHSSFLVCDFLAKHATTVLPQPLYSPDLAPADFFLFPKLKSTLKGRRFESIKTNLLAHLRSIPKTAFQECFRTLKKHWQRCIQSRGEYFEGDKVRLENFYAIYSGIFRTDLVFVYIYVCSFSWSAYVSSFKHHLLCQFYGCQHDCH